MRKFYVLGILLLGMPVMGWALGGARVQGGAENPALETKALFSVNRFSFLAGPQFYFVNDSAETAAALALRYELPSTNWIVPVSMELGAALPHVVPGDLKTEQTRNAFNFTYKANIHSITEEHLAIVATVPVGRQPWITPEIALGVSLAQFHNDTYFAPAGRDLAFLDNTHNAVTLYNQIGLRLQNPWPQFERLTLLLSTGYIHYPDQAVVGGQSFNLDLTGWTSRALLQVRL